MRARAIFGVFEIAASAFPPVGHTYEVNFGDDLVFHLRFDSQTLMQFTGVAGHNKGVSEGERITSTLLGTGVYLLSWQDGGGNTFVHIADFDQEAASLNLTLPDNLEETNTKLICLQGTLKQIDAAEPNFVQSTKTEIQFPGVGQMYEVTPTKTEIEFPGVGHVYEVTMGSDVFHVRFDSETSLTATGVSGPNRGFKERETITLTPVRPGLFMMSWQEASGTTAVFLEDFENQITYSHVTIPDDDGTIFLRFEGVLKQLD